ncbi:Lrp/AsnC family transcriptional regulator [Fodinisporobacter ferrooxydans]|uniref:Lrp/AsnC family transcriptional regulator n=1 Tax=Fodinisporobacter ferrooxydans TaxID=2901836 RepID=A0ABY4CES3_9BACL|nr:Lrp/AsnC family transcriptional regulator [Alicyclobacillaceae bacterium MYW30-H2]
MSTQLRHDILQLLHENSKLQPDTIADMLNVSKETVEKAIAQLEREHVILRYSTIINWDKVDHQRVTAMIDVKVTPQREVGYDALAERIYRFPEVKSLTLMSGAYDFSLVVEGYSVKDIGLFVSEKLSTIEHVQSTTTHFILKQYKEDGVIFEDREEDQRLVITP